MKFLTQDSRTTELLRRWANEDHLILAHHYFWMAGNTMQTSQLGLLQTLLVQIIQQGPEWIVDCLPTRFHDSGLDEYGGDNAPWTLQELYTTFLSLGKKSRSGVRLCLLIDGLDEYAESHTDLVDLILSLADSSCVKVCVSSRPWNVFTKTFDKRADGQLEVHTLTQNDIKTYVSDNITKNEHFRKLHHEDEGMCNYLSDEITTRAEGVFLWVYLVVKSLLRGMLNDDTTRILCRRLEEYPTSLDEYFQRMLDRVDSVYRVESARLMLLAFSAQDSLPFWTLRCLELELDNPGYAIDVKVSLRDASRVYGCDCAQEVASRNLCLDRGFGVQTMPKVPGPRGLHDTIHNCYFYFGEDHQLTSLQREALRTQLDARAADLLEVMQGGITFIHRTARDFLEQEGHTAKLYRQAGEGYNVELSLARLTIVNAKRRAWLQGHTPEVDLANSLMKDKKKLRQQNAQASVSLAAYLGHRAKTDAARGRRYHWCDTNNR